MIEATATYYSKAFWKIHGWVSCFECDEIFEDLEELFAHQYRHIEEETARLCSKLAEKC